MTDKGLLDAALLAAHAVNDLPDLVRLYTQAANASEAARDVDAACFYLTHAYVFALESGAPETDALNHRLWRHGRDDLFTPRPAAP